MTAANWVFGVFRKFEGEVAERQIRYAELYEFQKGDNAAVALEDVISEVYKGETISRSQFQ